MSEFYQSPPSLGNQFEEDRVLRDYLEWKLPAHIVTEIKPDLHRLGHRVVDDIYLLGKQAELTPPRHIPYDPWGRRVDLIETSNAWKELERISAEEQLVAIGYTRHYGALSRIYQFAKLYLFHPSSAVFTCPLAMTDGAARALELYGDEKLRQNAFQHLVSSDPKQFWTSGQWMTERTGGSDVSGTATVAIPDGSQFRLSGTKWFTSATTSQMAMTLARIDGAPEGSKGLSLFYLELRDETGALNNIRINRLKEKLGTHALPTAELTLEGARATLVGEPGDGVKKISSLFNITRLYNACCAVGYMRRAIALSRDYAQKRKAFGKYLSEHGLHLETLANLQVEFEAAFHLIFHAIELLGKEEAGNATHEESAVLRLLTPLAKLYTAKQGITVVSEALETFGGAGYVEDTGLPQLLRDAQVLAIWEGTTNVLSLDVLRAIRKEHALLPFINDMLERLNTIDTPDLLPFKVKMLEAVGSLRQYSESMMTMSDEEQQISARHYAFCLTQIYVAGLLLEHAQWALIHGKGPHSLLTARRWCSRDFTALLTPTEEYRKESKSLALDR
ncbi:acyl-CoA dehydrogenase family protein [Legionella bononiensis]|uniref:Acyl-CoA dehydrogenase family protein n=1 Tax=Legionella bononiensis TaxID=2793102 RepID=A0ABS1W6M9_9GAMM|nr:acyl-CoA dehydrogenase family protein [Legionella bononiensis]MBL7478397.1 acyl-CoA dehydrogenase family protein [Legionella bononiensis]MBL7524994.1 acyl-CoA dehydrogenase family protein [Legionella bononiensis]MBL7561291.1 acyl-CoA dehydrogenase family protein [Legionella bononiensis]